MKTPYVSVVMTSYNRGHYIGQAIDCILAQDCKFSFEIIIGDDCSTDNSRELLQSYQEKYPGIIVLNLQEKNVGFGPNWASTCKLARGKYIAFCDDDDYWCETNHMQTLADYLDAHENCGLVYANHWNLEVETKQKTLANNKLPDDEDKLEYMLQMKRRIHLFLEYDFDIKFARASLMGYCLYDSLMLTPEECVEFLQKNK